MFFRNAPAGLHEVAVFVCKDLGKNAAAVVPFVNQLIEDSGIGMLGNEAGSEQFDAHALDLLDEAGIVEEPPAAEDHQVAEFPGGDAKFVLVFAGEHGDEEFVFGELAAEVDDGEDIGLAGHVSGITERGIHAHARADHHGEGQSAFGADGEDGFFQNGLPGRFDYSRIGGIAEFRGEADGEVDGLLAVDPLAQ